VSKHFAVLLVAIIAGSPIALAGAADTELAGGAATGVEPAAQATGQDNGIAIEIARLASSEKSECVAAVKELVEIGGPAVPALIKVLSDPRNEVRALAAEALRAILAVDPASAPNCHEKAYWEQRIAQLKAGMAVDEALRLLLPELSPAERRKTCLASMWSGLSGSTLYRLDDYWTVDMNLTDFEHIKLHERAPDLIRHVGGERVEPPAGYTGAWVTWYVNGQRAWEALFRDGKHDGKFTAFYDDGSKQFERHYTMGICDGTETGWHRSGKKSYEGQYDHGKQVGTWRWWNENGQIKSTEEYGRGKRDEKREH
jgi:hypothetical protein